MSDFLFLSFYFSSLRVRRIFWTMFQFCNVNLGKKIILNKVNEMCWCCNKKTSVAKCNLWTLFFAGSIVLSNRKPAGRIGTLRERKADHVPPRHTQEDYLRLLSVALS